MSSTPISSSVTENASVVFDGEVEDYKLTIIANPYINPSNGLDVNNDGVVSPIDALQVINFLNVNGTTVLTAPANRPLPPYLDVNGNGIVEPRDSLLVINYLNARSVGGEKAREREKATRTHGSLPVPVLLRVLILQP